MLVEEGHDCTQVQKNRTLACEQSQAALCMVSRRNTVISMLVLRMVLLVPYRADIVVSPRRLLVLCLQPAQLLFLIVVTPAAQGRGCSGINTWRRSRPRRSTSPPAVHLCDAESGQNRAEVVSKAKCCRGTARDVRFKDGGCSMLRFSRMVPCTSPEINISGTATVLFRLRGTCSGCSLYLFRPVLHAVLAAADLLYPHLPRRVQDPVGSKGLYT
jgi:hypothetical protein